MAAADDKDNIDETKTDGLQNEPVWAVLGLSVPVDTASTQDVSISLNVSEENRLALQTALDLLDLRDLSGELTISAISGGRFIVKGEISANIIQECIATLEPVESKVHEVINLQYWPEYSGQVEANYEPGEISVSPLDEEPELIEDGKIDVGRLIFETFSTSIDPYPRKKEAVFEWQQGDGPEAGENGTDHPFAALKVLKSETQQDKE